MPQAQTDATTTTAAGALFDGGAPGPADPCRIGRSREPVLARWTGPERAALESAMGSGIAIVAADDCRGVRLLAGCRVRGHYGYLGRKPTTYAVDLATDEELRINAPLAVGVAISDAGGQSTRLDLAIVGRRATTRSLLTPSELTGDCEGATHFVAEADVGSAELFAGGTPAAGGVGDACSAARPGDVAPPATCNDLVAIHINPIAALGELITFDHAPENAVLPIGACPDGMVVSRRRCVRPPVSAPYLCAFGDPAGCGEQCNRGDENSCDVLAFMFKHGKGAPVDMTRAVALYTKTCGQDDWIACSNLAECQRNGEGVPKDPRKALALFRRACDLGDAGSCANLGLAYLTGAGVAVDAARGLSLLERSCDAGSAGACEQLARRLIGGDAGPDAARGRAMLDELCDGNNGSSCAELGRITYLGEGVPSDHARAAALLTRGCHANDGHACVMAGLMYRQSDGVARDDVLATRLMTEACNRGEPSGCLNLGIAYEHGKGIAPDAARAAALYEQACTAKVAQACLYFADFLNQGIGVEKDTKRAAGFYAQACALGEGEGCAHAP